MPPTKENSTSVHIDLAKWRITDAEGLTVINRFLSMMAWVDDHFAIAQDGWSGNPIPVPVHRRQLAFVTSHGWYFDRRSAGSAMAQTALALYREARNAEENFLISYAVLNYYKIIELQHPKGPSTRAWIADHISEVQGTLDASIVERFRDACGALPAEKYIYDACQLAVAHASERTPSDPDLASELTRLHVAADMLRPLSRHAMQEIRAG